MSNTSNNEQNPIDLDFVPSTIEEAVNHMYQRMQPKDVDLCHDHHGFGMGVRNCWCYWQKETPIKRDAVEKYRIAHGDDLSGLTFAWLEAKLKNQPFDPVAYCERFHRHWKREYNMSSLEAGGYNNDGTPQDDE